MLTRRHALLVAAMAGLRGTAFAQDRPKLFTLPTTIEIMSMGRLTMELGGWLVVNGAWVLCEREPVLFERLKYQYGGDGNSLFALPQGQVEYSTRGTPKSGYAICPSEALGVVAEVKPFSIDGVEL